MTPVAGTARHTPTRHHDRTAAYPVEAPFMTPGTEAVRHTPTRHDGTHAAQQRTHAGDMNVAPTLPAVPTRTDEKTAGHLDRTAAYPAVSTCTDEKTTGHLDRTVAYPVGAPFMTPGTGAERQTPTRHDGTHAVQQRTHAGDMNVAPTLTAVSTHTDEKTAGHHDRTAAYPVGAPFMTPGTETVRQTPTRHDGAHAAQWRTHAGDMNVAPTLTAVSTCTDEKTAGRNGAGTRAT